MKTPKSIAFRAIRILVITAVAFAGIVYVHLRRQEAASEVDPSARVVALAEGEELEPLLARAPVVVVSFGGEECSHCQALKPHLHQLADAHPEDLRVVLVDAYTHTAPAREAGVEAIPDTRIYVGGKSVDRRLGYQSHEALQEWLKPHIAAAAYMHT
ncbi:MAG: thioredoxin family protein, partial [Verrucomicrobiota bacterium]